MIEMLVGAMVMAAVATKAPAAIADAYTAMKAANAGEWDALDRQHERRDARAQRRHDLAGRILARRRAKADGEPQRPGLGTFVGDVWHGMWEDALDQRTARRANRPPVDPDRPTLADRVTARIRERVQANRPPTPPPATRRPNPHRAPQPRPAPPADPVAEVTGPRCPDCGQPLHPTATGWDHPGGPTCPETGEPYGTPTVPAPGPQSPARHLLDELDKVRRAPRCPRHDVVLVDGSCSVCDDPDDLPCGRCDQPLRAHTRVPTPGHPDGADFACPRTPRPAGPLGERTEGGGQPMSEWDDDGPIPPDSLLIDKHQLGAELFGHRCDNPACETCWPYSARRPNPRHDHPPTTEGDTMTAPAIDEVTTNEAARRAFDQMASGAKKLADAAALAEQARAEIATASQASADGMSGVRFDAGATAAVNDVVDAVGTDTLTRWAEVADSVDAAATAGKAALDKYVDAEHVVAENAIDPTTLASTQS